MTLEEMYRNIEGNYPDILRRLRKEERIEKFVLLFLKDSSYQTFCQALEQGNTEEAFRAIHTLKGVCMNLSFDGLYRISSEMTEYLRANQIDKAMAALPDLCVCSVPIPGTETAGEKIKIRCLKN